MASVLSFTENEDDAIEENESMPTKKVCHVYLCLYIIRNTVVSDDY